MKSPINRDSSLEQISISISDTAIPSFTRVGSKDAYNHMNTTAAVQGGGGATVAAGLSRLASLSLINSQKALLLDQHAIREGEQLRSNLFQHHDSFLRRFQDNNDSSQSVHDFQSDLSHSPSYQISPSGQACAAVAAQNDITGGIDQLQRTSGKLSKNNTKHLTAIVSNEQPWSNLHMNNHHNSSNRNSILTDLNIPTMIASTPTRNIAGQLPQRHQNKLPSNLINPMTSSNQMYDSSYEGSQAASNKRANHYNYEGTENSGTRGGFVPASKFQFALKKVQTQEEGASAERGNMLNSTIFRGIEQQYTQGNNHEISLIDDRRKNNLGLNGLTHNLQQQSQQQQQQQQQNSLHPNQPRTTRVSILNTANKTSFKLFKKVNLVKKFASQLLSNLNSRTLQKMQYRHYQIINDKIFQASHKEFLHQESQTEALISMKSQPWSPRKSQGSFHRVFGANNNSNNYNSNPSYQYKISKAFKKVSSNILDSIPIFLPNNPLQICWNICLLIFLIIFFALTPLLTIFDDSQNQLFLLATEHFGLGVIIIEIFLNLNTGFYHEGEVVKSRTLIFKKYFEFYFWLDLLTIACFVVVMSHADMQYLKLISLARIMQIMKLLNSIEEHFQLQQKFYTTYELTKLFALVFFVAHYCGAIFCFISRADYEKNLLNDTWIKKNNLVHSSWDSVYLDSLYFSIITMITVGFGDIVPISSNEKIFVILFSIVSCGIFGYAVNTIGSIFQELSQKQASYKLKKFEITQYMEGRNIQRTSQIKVLKYLEYMNSQEEERNYLLKGEFILSNISKNLRDEVTRDFFRRILLGSNIFSNVFSNKLLDQLALVMKEITLGPGDIIFNRGDLDNKLYFVFKGSVEHTLDQENRVIKFGNYTVGDYFGQSGFFADLPRTFTAKSKGNSHIVFCKREDMLRLIQENPLDLEAFSMIKDEILFKEEVSGHKCLLCSSPSHNEQKCNLVNFRANRPMLILKNNFSVDQTRQKCDRRDQSKHAKLNYPNKHLIRNHLKKFRADCVLEALENSEDFNILQDTRMSDKDFFLRLPKVKYSVETALMIEETEDSLYSDEDFELFSKEDSRNNQDFEPPSSLVSGSVQNIQQQPPNHHGNVLLENKRNRIKSRHQTTKVNFTPIEEITSWNQMFRSKTRNDTFQIHSPSQRGPKNVNNNAYEPSQNSSFVFEEVKRTEKRNNTGATVKTHKTLQRNDSISSLKSHHKEFNRNASRNMSHFGAAAVNSNGMVIVSSNPRIAADTPKAVSVHQIPPPLIPIRNDSQIRIERQQQQQQQNQNTQSEMKEQFASSYFLSAQDQEFDLLKEFTVYYPSNNLSQILRQIKKSWIDKFQKKRFKTKNTYKNTQKSKVSNKPTKSDIKTNKTIKSALNAISISQQP